MWSCCSAAASKVDQAAVYHLKVLLHVVKSENAASRGQRAHVPAPVRHRHPGTSDLGTGPGRIRDGLAEPRWPPDREPDRSAADDRSGTAGRHAGAVGPAAPRLLYRLPFVLPARVPHGERQHAARDVRRVRARLWPSGDCASARCFTVIRRGIVSPSSPATLSRNMASSPTRRRSTMRWGSLPSGRSRSRPRSISIGRPFAPQARQGI